MNRPHFLSAHAPSPTSLPLAWLSLVGLELRLWVATCVTGLAVFCAAVLGVHPDQGGSIEALLVVFFSTLALYNLDGSLDAHGRSLPPSGKRAHLTLTAASLLAVGFLTSMLAPSTFALTAAGLAACSLYALPFSSSKRALRLKTLPHLKAPFVGTSVAVAVVWVPLAAGSQPRAWAQGVCLTIVLALYCTANALLFDIPDREEDRQQHTPTVAVKHGVDGAKRLSALLCAAALVMIVGLGALQLPRVHFSWQAAFGLMGLGVFLLLGGGRIDQRTRASTIAWLVDAGLLLPLILLSALT